MEHAPFGRGVFREEKIEESEHDAVTGKHVIAARFDTTERHAEAGPNLKSAPHLVLQRAERHWPTFFLWRERRRKKKGRGRGEGGYFKRVTGKTTGSGGNRTVSYEIQFPRYSDRRANAIIHRR